MSTVSGTIRRFTTETGESTPTIYNISISLAFTETPVLLSNNTKQFLVRGRDTCTIYMAFNVGESGTNYITIGPGCNYSVSGINFTGSLYLQTNKPSQVIEILEWT